MQTVNLALIIGRLAAKPERVPMPDGTMIVRARVATNESWTDRASGERKQRTDWHRLVARDSVGDRLVEFGEKGAQVYVRGRQRASTYSDRNQVEQTVVDIEVFDVRFLTSNGGSSSEVGSRPERVAGTAPHSEASRAAPTPEPTTSQKRGRADDQPAPVARPTPTLPAAPATDTAGDDTAAGETIEFEGEF